MVVAMLVVVTVIHVMTHAFTFPAGWSALRIAAAGSESAPLSG